MDLFRPAFPYHCGWTESIKKKKAALNGPGAIAGLRTRTDVFISYAREDRGFADELRHALGAVGMSIWMDDSSIPQGAPFLSVIYAGIEGASSILTILSPEFADSRFCRLEIEHAAALGKRFIPVQRREVGPELLPPCLQEIQWVPFPREREFSAGAQECIAAARFDLEWTTLGVRFLQRALDWIEARAACWKDERSRSSKSGGSRQAARR